MKPQDTSEHFKDLDEKHIPNPSQLRREYERRTKPVRQYTPCIGDDHLLIMAGLKLTSTAGILQMLNDTQVRTDIPSYLVEPCSCGGGIPTSRWS